MTRTRPKISEASTSTGPYTSDSGSTRAISEPTSRRTTCGTTRPTKPIGPATAVAAPHSAIIAIIVAPRTIVTGTPRPAAASSPSARARRGPISINDSTKPNATKGSADSTCSKVRFSSEPTTQKRCESKAFELNIVIMPVIVPRQAFTATPVSTRRAVESRFGLESTRPMTNTSAAARPEPSRASHS